MARLFGTDGIRGLANSELTPELALSVAAAAVRLLGATAAGDRSHRPVVVVGRDPRASGEMIEAAIVAGLTAAGADVLRAGVLPTPATAYLTAETGADFGVMISASHNPMPDNGVKLFSRGGHKLTDEVEDGIEALAASGAGDRPTGAGIGRVRDIDDATGRYLAHLRSAVGVNVSGLRLVVDCANGAASAVAPQAYRQAGARVTVIHADPDGLNINDRCGSTHLEALAAAVRDEGADLGIAHDGDADRALAIASDGSVVDGDAILAVCAIALHEAGNLAADTVVATVMSNLGFHHAMRDAGISVLTTPVGDRYLLEALRGNSLSLGGEQSGHLVFAEYATTGDGLLTGLRLMARIAQTGNALADLAAVVRRLPQVLVNVRVADKATVAASEKVTEAVVAVERQLGDSGRVLLRPSGTESVVRVMVEAPTDEQAAALASRVATAVAGA